MLLADVFEKFVNTCLQYYGLDPCHFSRPGLSWDAMRQMTGIELEPTSDIGVRASVYGKRNKRRYFLHC